MSSSGADRPAAAADQQAALTPAQVRLAVGGVMVGMLLSALDQTVVGTALPRIAEDLHALDQLSWVVTAYLLTSIAATPLWGKVSDLYGRRPTFQAAVVIFLIGSALCGAAQGITGLLLFRAVQGIGAGGLFVLALSVIADAVPPESRGRYQGFVGALYGVASIAGPPIGGWLTGGPGWRWVFYINVPLGLAALVVTSMGLRLHSVRRKHRIDYPGVLLLVTSVTALLLYLDWAGVRFGWAAPRSLGLVAAFLALGAAFVLVETRAAEPVLPMGLFRNGLFSLAGLFGFLAGAAMFGGIVFLPLYLQEVHGMTPTVAGLAMLPALLAMAVGSVFSGQVISRTGRYKVFPVVGSALLVAAMPLLATAGVHTPYWLVALYSAAYGTGVGFTMQPIITAVQNSVPREDIGAATSTANFFQRMGAAIGTAALGATLTSSFTSHLAAATGRSAAAGGRLPATQGASLSVLPEPLRSLATTAFAHALSDVFLVCLPISALALVVSFLLKESTPPPAAAEPADDPTAEATGAGV